MTAVLDSHLKNQNLDCYATSEPILQAVLLNTKHSCPLQLVLLATEISSLTTQSFNKMVIKSR